MELATTTQRGPILMAGDTTQFHAVVRGQCRSLDARPARLLRTAGVLAAPGDSQEVAQPRVQQPNSADDVGESVIEHGSFRVRVGRERLVLSPTQNGCTRDSLPPGFVLGLTALLRQHRQVQSAASTGGDRLELAKQLLGRASSPSEGNARSLSAPLLARIDTSHPRLYAGSV